MNGNISSVYDALLSMRDDGYRLFTAKLIPTVPPDYIIGVRTPKLREFAKKMDKTMADSFVLALPHRYYEENNLHACLIERIDDFDRCIYELNRFLPNVDNWATCDMMRPKILGANKPKLLKYIKVWLNSKDTYTLRFAIEMLMVHFLDKDFNTEYLEWVAAVKSEEYYINMMLAWYFATALAKQYESAVTYLENCKLSKWVHNKTISKACDSYRINVEQKIVLKTLRY